MQRRFPGSARQRGADAVQQPVAGTLCGHHLPGAGPLGRSGVLAQLWYESGELGPGRVGELRAPDLVARQRQLADRPHPGLEGDDRLGRAARQRHHRALSMRICGRGGRVAGLADSWFSEDQHRSASRPRRRRLMQHADLPVPADQRLLSVCGEQLRHRDVDLTDNLHRRRAALGRRAAHRLYAVGRQVSPAQLRRPHRGRHALQLEIASRIQRHPVARGHEARHQLLHQDLPGSSRR